MPEGILSSSLPFLGLPTFVSSGQLRGPCRHMPRKTNCAILMSLHRT